MSNRSLFTKSIVVIASVLSIGFIANAQQVSSSSFPTAVQRTGDSQPAYAWSFPAAGTSKQVSQYQEVQKRVKAATEKMRQADDDDQLEAARKDLELALEEDYDVRLDSYEAKINQMEKQLEEMRSKLERRRQAKREMVRLRMQLLEAEADDLGWPTPVTTTHTLWNAGGAQWPLNPVLAPVPVAPPVPASKPTKL